MQTWSDKDKQQYCYAVPSSSAHRSWVYCILFDGGVHQRCDALAIPLNL